MSTLKGFFGGNQSKVPAISPYHPWLALVLLEIEFKTQDSYIWTELLRQLNTAGSKPNVDAVLKVCYFIFLLSISLISLTISFIFRKP